jgi:hypothetical protein
MSFARSNSNLSCLIWWTISQIGILFVLGVHCVPSTGKPVSRSSNQLQQSVESNSEPEKARCDFSAYKPISLGYSTDGYAIRLPKPKYPPRAKRKNKIGAVKIKFLINARSGIVQRACIITGDQIFVRVSRNAALRSRFSFSGNRALPQKYNYAVGIITYRFITD